MSFIENFSKFSELRFVKKYTKYKAKHLSLIFVTVSKKFLKLKGFMNPFRQLGS